MGKPQQIGFSFAYIHLQMCWLGCSDSSSCANYHLIANSNCASYQQMASKWQTQSVQLGSNLTAPTVQITGNLPANCQLKLCKLPAHGQLELCQVPAICQQCDSSKWAYYKEVAIKLAAGAVANSKGWLPTARVQY